MPVINVTVPQTIAVGAGVLNRIFIPYQEVEDRFPRVNSKVMIQVADSADHTKITPLMYGTNYDTAMLVGTRVPYYWEQTKQYSDPNFEMITECVLSLTTMPFYKGLSVTSLPEGAILGLRSFCSWTT
jgi:hypothetical protein